MNSVLDSMRRVGLIPVIKVDKAEDAVPLCRALYQGGLPVAEITFRTAAAAEAIRLVRAALPQMLTGAGTVTSLDYARQALEAGAQFVVTPGFNPQVVQWCQKENLPVLPGCTTPSEVESAQNMGLEAVKFFPAEQSGGLAKIKALSGPYPAMHFIPTGGIDLGNILSYLSFDKVLACGGSFMINAAHVASGQWEAIRQATSVAMQHIAGLHLERVELPAASPEVAEDMTKRCAALLGSGSGLVLGQGTQPCLVFVAHCLERACYQLRQRGYASQERVLEHDDKGRPTRMELPALLEGFDVALLRKP